MSNPHPLAYAVPLLLAAAVSVGCSTAPKTPGQKDELRSDAQEALDAFFASDPSLRDLIADSAGYAVFPSVGKGAVGIGGAFGRGVLYDAEGSVLGYATLSQATIGLQLGGQSYRELIVFEDADAVGGFKSGDFAFSAQASAVAATAGASADADYENGVLVFTLAKGGLMYEASIGGQKFAFEPVE